MQAQIIIRDSYETSHEIFDHNSPEGEDPFSLIRMRWSEDMVTEGRLHQWIKKFARKRIGKIFNISFKEFLEQPSYVCEMMYEEACEKGTQEAADADDALDALNGIGVKPKK